jgi:Squalene/phytoene synthase
VHRRRTPKVRIHGSEIAHLFAGRPQHDVTRGLSEAIHLYGLRCDDFLGIIDGMEMDARRDIRAPSIAELDRYCERVAVAVGRLSVRIFGEATPAGERVAAELGRALQLTNILRDLAEDAGRHRLYLPREMLHARGIFATTPNWVLAQPALAEVCNDPAPIVPRPVVAAPPAEPATAHLDQEKVPSAPAAEMMTPTPEPRMATSRAQHKSSRAVRKPHVSHVRRGPLSLRPGVLTPPPTTWHGGGY